MKYFLSTAFIFSCFLMTFSLTAQEGRSLDSLELVKFYEATGGANWINPWNLSLPMEEWEGITMNFEGRVTTIGIGRRNLKGELIDFDLPFLENLSLTDNDNLSGILIDFSSLPSLQVLNLLGNSLAGNVPDFSSLSSLRILHLRHNELVGKVPDFSNLPSLKELDIGFNGLSGEIPDFSNLEKLEILDLCWSDLTGKIPDFSNLPNLKRLSICLSDLVGEIPDFSNLLLLEYLDVYSNELTGKVPDFSHLPELKELMVRFNDLTGEIPDFSKLSNLVELNLSDNNFIGEIPDFNHLVNLEILNLNTNNLTGNIPDFRKLPNLTLLWCEENNLTGEIPNFSNISNLVYIRVGSNNLKGNIPSFDKILNLKYLNCESNNLEGTVPSFSNMDSLSSLVISDNNLTGPLPTFIGSSLDRIICSNNNLSGKIDTYGQHSKFRFLECENNDFEMIDSNFLQNKPNLSRVLLKGNQFTNEDLIPIFESIEKEVDFTYVPQDSVFRDTTYVAQSNAFFTINLDFDIELATNAYTWYKNDTLYQTIQGNNKLTFQNIQPTDAGIYTVEITNPNLPDLTLNSHPITIQVNEELENQLETTITASDMEGATDETISIPVKLNGLPTIAALEGTFQLSNPQIGQMVGIEPGLIEDLLFNTTTGQFNWFDANGEGVALANDTLFYVQVALAGEQGDSSLLNLDAVKVWSFENENLDEVAVRTQTGTIKIVNDISLLGSIQSYQNKGINQTTIAIKSSYKNIEKSDTTYSLPTGSYELSTVQAGSDLTIQPSKTGNSRNGLSSVALFLAQRHLLGFEVAEITSPFQLVAGDANCDGRFSVVDLFLIQRMIVGIDEQFASCPNWKFTPALEVANFVFNASTYYPNYPFPTEINLTNQRESAAIDFIGIKTGDILNRADLSAFRPTLGAQRSSVLPPLQFYFSEQEIVTGDTFCMTLGVTEFQNIGSIQFSLGWDTTTVQFQSGQTILENANLNINKSSDGQLAISWFDIEGQGISLPDSSDLLTLCFVALADTDGTAIRFTDSPTPIEVVEFDGSSINILDIERTEVDLVIAPCDAFNLGEDIQLCSGDILILDATFQENTSYDWFQNDVLILTDSIGQLMVTEEGLYTVKKKNTTNCILTDTIQISILEDRLTTEERYTCGIIAARTDTLNLINENGCDSMVVINYQPIRADTMTEERYICGIIAARIDTLNLINENGCDSMILINSLPIKTDTTLLTTYTCFPDEVNRETQNLTSQSGCDSIVIEEIVLQAFNTTFTVGVVKEDCLGEASKITITNGDNENSPYLYSIDNGVSFTTDSVFNNLPEGTYPIVIENIEGCQQNLTTTIQVNQPNLILPQLISLSLGDSIQLRPAWSNLKNPIFKWTPNTDISCTTCPNPSIRPSKSSTYTLNATDESGCSLMQSIQVNVNESADLFVPTIFSPNNDGVNDFLTFFAGKGVSEVIVFRIFDRWGTLLYEAGESASIIGWDGKIRGIKAQIGTYIYVLQAKKQNGKEFIKTGTVNLVR